MLIAAWYAPDWIVGPMKSLLIWFMQMTGNYGWAIILLTIVVRFVILPLTIYQTKSTKRMQEVQPLIKEIQTKYKDNPEKLNQEMMNVYKTQGVNPFAGCLPVLIQMPFLWAIFALLQGFDPTAFGGHNQFLWLELNKPDYFMAGLTMVSMFLQSYLGAALTDPTQKTMMYMLPLVFGFMTFQMQSGVVLYWVVSTLFGLVQQGIYPGFPKKDGPGEKGVAGAR